MEEKKRNTLNGWQSALLLVLIIASVALCVGLEVP